MRPRLTYPGGFIHLPHALIIYVKLTHPKNRRVDASIFGQAAPLPISQWPHFCFIICVKDMASCFPTCNSSLSVASFHDTVLIRDSNLNRDEGVFSESDGGN